MESVFQQLSGNHKRVAARSGVTQEGMLTGRRLPRSTAQHISVILKVINTSGKHCNARVNANEQMRRRSGPLLSDLALIGFTFVFLQHVGSLFLGRDHEGLVLKRSILKKLIFSSVPLTVSSTARGHGESRPASYSLYFRGSAVSLSGSFLNERVDLDAGSGEGIRL